MLLVPGHNRGNMATVSLHIHKLDLSYILNVFQLKTTWRLGNVLETRIDRSCCGGIFTGSFVSLLRQKDTCWQIALSFQLFIIFSERESPQITSCCLRPDMKIWLPVLTF